MHYSRFVASNLTSFDINNSIIAGRKRSSDSNDTQFAIRPNTNYSQVDVLRKRIWRQSINFMVWRKLSIVIEHFLDFRFLT